MVYVTSWMAVLGLDHSAGLPGHTAAHRTAGHICSVLPTVLPTAESASGGPARGPLPKKLPEKHRPCSVLIHKPTTVF